MYESLSSCPPVFWWPYRGGGLNPLKLQLKWRADLQVRWIDQRIEPTTYFSIPSYFHLQKLPPHKFFEISQAAGVVAISLDQCPFVFLI